MNLARIGDLTINNSGSGQGSRGTSAFLQQWDGAEKMIQALRAVIQGDGGMSPGFGPSA
jgi:hypothetical protein